MESLSVDAGLARSKYRGTEINTVIDVGASDGRWSKIAMKYYPEASYFLIEAQPGHEESLKRMKQDFTNVDYVLAAAGDQIGATCFDASGLFGGAVVNKLNDNSIITPMITIDHCIKERRLKPPFLLKLDTHGFEVPILEGANEALKQASLLIIEAYNFDLTEASLRFYELCVYMEEKGFRCIDLIEPLHRPKDGSFWQIDLVFSPKNSKSFQSNLTFYMETSNCNGSVLIVYNSKGKDPSKSKTYQSILQQSYRNYHVFLGDFSDINLSDVGEDFICFIEEGYLLDEHFIRVMISSIEKEDYTICGLQRVTKDGNLFYNHFHPVHDLNTLLPENERYLACMFFRTNSIRNKGNFNANLLKHLRFRYVGTALVKVIIEKFIRDRLKEKQAQKIYIYGAGEHTRQLLNNVDFTGFTICGIIDQNEQLTGQLFLGKYPIYSVKKISKLDTFFILVSSSAYEEEIFQKLKQRIDKNRIIRIHDNNVVL